MVLNKLSLTIKNKQEYNFKKLLWMALTQEICRTHTKL